MPGRPLGEGDEAPDVEVELSDGSRVRLSQLRGRIVVLYFYPKAFTRGCTREAVKFNKLYDEFKRLGAEVIGVSVDSRETNARFAERYGLRFKLGSDRGRRVAEAFGVLRGIGPIKLADRVTFVIDSSGRIAKVIRGRLRAEEHAIRALEEVRRLTSSSGGGNRDSA